MYQPKTSGRSENLLRAIQVILKIRRRRSTMSQQAWNTAVMGLSLTAICLVGASASITKMNKVEKRRELAHISKDKIHDLLMELCSKVPDSLSSLLEGFCNLYGKYIEDRRLKKEGTDSFEDVVDMTIISHVGCCQCEAVMFMMEAPRSLKIEPPSVGTADDEDMADVNSFPKTIVQQKHFSLIQGKDNIRSYQKPYKGKESEYHHALAVYAFSHRTKRDQALNPNTIQTFCGLCGTQLVWKPHHKRDAHPLLHVNVQCLKSDWIPLPETKQNLVSHKPLPSSRKPVKRDLQKRMDSFGELSTVPSTVSSSVSSVHSEQSKSKEPVHDVTPAIVSPPGKEDIENSKCDKSVGSSSSYSQSRLSGVESDTVQTLLEQKFHSYVSVEGEDMDRSVCSETASIVTTSSMSMTSGWRLRDPNGVWSTMGPSTPGSKLSLEDRLSDKTSQDALLFQMRKHLSRHTRPRNVQPKSLKKDDDSRKEDEMSIANSLADSVLSTPSRKPQATPMSTTNKVLYGKDSSYHSLRDASLRDGLAPTSIPTKLFDDDSIASPVSALGDESPNQVYEPPSIFFNKILRPTR